MTIPAHLIDLYRALPRSHDTATSIPKLAFRLGIDERQVREQIKELREECGVPVMTLPTPRGVWLTSSATELDRLIATQTSRARSIEQSVRVLERVRDNLSSNPALF